MMVIGGLTITVGGVVIPRLRFGVAHAESPQFSMILVDFNKCTGCRTCETVCGQYNHKAVVNGEQLLGLGNPYLSNIRVYSFNPDVDVPIVCVMCRDNPCIEACPVEEDEDGRRALYRDPKTLAIKNDPERCITCGACAEACRTQRVEAIVPNPKTNRPERMCTLCDGDPQCVKYCPYGALDHIVGGYIGGSHYGLPAEKIAKELIERWYGVKLGKGGARG
ncbi:MAG: 4Fe-4S dicluster domain-containing protein [Candidatus Latescibacteria bacterium]|nr:4Fe-4S dicluster domain-containing protein [Candidatus Latescibacterota bacterium]NIO57376.1 4Fe-4S dicluster domain-containing protein [Candidatus Latescibacterota bacterium]